MSNFFDQPDPLELSEGRNIPEGSPQASQAPQPTAGDIPDGLGVPQESSPIIEEQPEQVTTEQVPEQQAQPGEQQVQPEQPFIPQSVLPVNPSRYYDVHGFDSDISGASRRLQNKTIEAQQGQLSVEQFLTDTGGTPYSLPDNLLPQDITPDLEGNIERTRKLREEAYKAIELHNFRRDHGIEFNNAIVHPDGTVTPKTPTISLDTSQNGTVSDMGQSVESSGGSGLLGRFFNSPFGRYLTEHGDYDGIANLVNKFDPRATQVGDQTLGVGTVVGLGLKVLNTVESVLVGGIYDIVDNTIMRMNNDGVDPHKGVRVWQALVEGKDWGVSNRWSPEKYLSWNEPEGFKAGDRVTQEFWEKEENRIIPEFMQRHASIMWDLPENIASAVSQGKPQREQTISRALHWTLQGIPSFAFEIFMGGVADVLVGKTVKGVREGLKNYNNVLNQTEEVLPELIQLPGREPLKMLSAAADDVPTTPYSIVPRDPNIDPGDVISTRSYIRYTSPDGKYTVEIPVQAVDAEIVDDLPPGLPEQYLMYPQLKSELVSSKLLNPASVVEDVTRNSEDLTEAAKRITDTDGKPLVTPSSSGILTDTEIGALRSSPQGAALGEFGTPINRNLSDTTTLKMPDETVVKVEKAVHPPPENPGTTIMGINSDNAYTEYDRLTDVIKKKIGEGADIKELAPLYYQRNVALAKLADEGKAYDAIKQQYPKDLQSESPSVVEDMNDYIRSDIKLSGESAEASRILEQIDSVNAVNHELKAKLELYPLYRGNLSVEKTTKEASTGIVDDTISIKDDVIPVDPPRNKLLEEELLAHKYSDEVAAGTRKAPTRSMPELLAEKQGITPNLGTPRPNVELPDSPKPPEFRTVDVSSITTKASSEGLDPNKVEELAKSIVRNEGSLAQPIYIKRIGGDSYELVEGSELGYFAAKRAEEIDPKRAEMVTVYLVDDSNVKQIIDQSKRYFSGEYSVNSKQLTNPAKPAQHYQVDTSTIRPPVESKELVDPKEVEDLARSIIKNKGALAKPLIVRQISVDNYELVSNELGYYAAKRAEEIDPRLGEMVSVYVVDDSNIEQITEQAFRRTRINLENSELDKIRGGKVKLRSKNNNNLIGNIPALDHTIDYVQKQWKHGTSYTGDLRQVIPYEGASPSEYGMGVYLTLRDDVAKSAAIKGDLPNKPFSANFGNDYTSPRLHTVDVSSLANVLKGDDSMGKLIRRQWHIASSQTTNEFKLGYKTLGIPEGTKIENMFNVWKEQYYAKYGEVPSELLVEHFQKRLTKNLADIGYEGMFVDKNGIQTLVVYKPNQLDIISTSPVEKTNNLGEVMEAKRHLEGVTAEQLADDVSIANATKAQKEFADFQLQELTEEYYKKEQLMVEQVNNMFDIKADTSIKHIDNVKADVDTVTNNLPAEQALKNEKLTDIQRDPC